MGISGLLPLLRSITRRTHLQELAGSSVAIDAYSWLHKGIYGSCAVDIFHGRPNDSFIEFCMSKLQLLLAYNVKPIMVFDGGRLPMKQHQEALRHQYLQMQTLPVSYITFFLYRSRKQSLAKAKELLAAGDSKGAYLQIQRAVDVTPQMAARLMRELRRQSIDFVVAPYEADAQMAWFARNDRVAAVITEDSDLLLFATPRILFKLDRDGFADEVQLSRLSELTELDMSMLSFEQFRQICMLSGCDYLPPIYGMGLKTAHRYVCRYRSIGRVLQVLRAELPPGRMPSGYEAEFAQAELTFMHQRVYDVEARALCYLNPLPAHQDLNEGNSWDFLGPAIEDIELVRRICEGQVCPNSWEPFDLHNEKVIDIGRYSDAGNPLRADEAPEIGKLPFEVHLDKHVMAERITLKRSLPVVTGEIRGFNHSATGYRKFAYSTSSIREDRRAFSHIPKVYNLNERSKKEPTPLNLDPKQRSIRDYFKQPTPS